MSTSTRERLEVHTHSYLTSDWRKPKVEHSHADSSVGHQHPDTGPAAYVIDKDDWFAATGARGGGRKKYTTKPKGEQLARVELEDWQKTFTVVLTDSGTPPPAGVAVGPEGAAIARMRLAHDMSYDVQDDRTVLP